MKYCAAVLLAVLALSMVPAPSVAPDFSALKGPSTMRALYAGDFARLAKDRAASVYYLFGMQIMLSKSDLAAFAALADRNVETALGNDIIDRKDARLDAIPAAGTRPGVAMAVVIAEAAAVDANDPAAGVIDAGQDDLLVMLGRMDGCGSQRARMLYRKMATFSRPA